jgi:hypothetical protein
MFDMCNCLSLHNGMRIGESHVQQRWHFFLECHKEGYLSHVQLTRIHTQSPAACINQDSPNPAEQLNGSMGRIIGSCDLMVTPVFDPDWKNWSSNLKEIKDAFTGYLAPGFVEYLGRAWCRLEMFFNSNVAINAGRSKLFGGRLRQFMLEEKRRPHLVFGTREQELGEMPLILRVLEDEEFSKYHPEKGSMFDKRDAVVIGAYVRELYKINSKVIQRFLMLGII